MHLSVTQADAGATLRVGVVDCGIEEDAAVEWQPDGTLCLRIPESNVGMLRPVQVCAVQTLYFSLSRSAAKP